MFTGIVQGTARVSALKQQRDFFALVLEISTTLVENVKVGASIAVNGVCLTVVNIERGSGDVARVQFDLSKETMLITTLDDMVEGDMVNIERSLQYGDEIGGHVVSGHVDTTAKIVEISDDHVVTFSIDTKWMKYILPKGFIAIDGASLTVNDVNKDKGTFAVMLIPETMRQTYFDGWNVGDTVNIEIDRKTQAIIDTTESFLSKK